MNKAYRLIWSKAKDRWVIAAEIIKGNGGPSPITVAAAVVTSLIMAVSGAHALPVGGQVAAGQAAISTPSATQMHINQGTNQAIINERLDRQHPSDGHQHDRAHCERSLSLRKTCRSSRWSRHAGCGYQCLCPALTLLAGAVPADGAG